MLARWTAACQRMAPRAMQGHRWCSTSQSGGLSPATLARMQAVRVRQEKPEPAAAGVPLDVPFPAPAVAASSSAPGELQTTELANGVRVVTVLNGQEAGAVSVRVKAGARDEAADPRFKGCSFLNEKMMMKSTSKFPSGQAVAILEDESAICYSQATREDTGVYGEATAQSLPKVAEILLDTAANTNFEQDDFDEQLGIVERFLSQDYHLSPDLWMYDTAHAVAFGTEANQGTLGREPFPRMEELPSMKKEDVAEFKKTFTTPDRIVVANTGVEHEEIVRMAEDILGDLPAPAVSAKNADFKECDFATNYYALPEEHRSTYTGGYVTLLDGRQEFFEANNMVPPVEYKDLGSAIVAFEGVSAFSQSDFYAACVLQSLMGGGSSFSSGGPGKGMYTRAYRNILRYSFVENASCFLVAYAETGLFGLYVDGEQDKLNNMLELACVNLAQMSEIHNDELTRAKNLLKSQMFARLETRGISVEDLGSQVLHYGGYLNAREHEKRIEAVTVDQVKELVTRMLRTTPTVVLNGKAEHLEKAHKMREIQMFFVNNFGNAKANPNA